jgi:hypothetical protein
VSHWDRLAHDHEARLPKLRDEAAQAMKKASAVLAETQDD